MVGVEKLVVSGPQGGELDQSAVVETTLAGGFPWLTFPQALEQRFLIACEDKRLALTFMAGIAAVVLFAALLIAEYLMTPDVLSLAIVLRFGVFPGAVLTGLWLVSKLRRPLLTEWLIALAGLVAALLEATILLSSHGVWAIARVAELNIIIVYTCAIARFWPAVTVGMAVALVHAYLVSAMPDPTGVLVFSNSLLMISCMVFVLYGNYKLEHDERMSFLLDAREQTLHAQLTVSHARVNRMATTDVLTDVANRRYFETFLAESWARAQAQSVGLSLLILDIDEFKRYNDRYGHQAGDRCLVSVALALKDCIRRPGDLLARWGGEEFVVVMLDADESAAAAAAERVRRAVLELGLAHDASSCAGVVTVSVGVASLHLGETHGWPELVSKADVALYRAKAEGRNRVCIDGIDRGAAYAKLRA